MMNFRWNVDFVVSVDTVCYAMYSHCTFYATHVANQHICRLLETVIGAKEIEKKILKKETRARLHRKFTKHLVLVFQRQ